MNSAECKLSTEDEIKRKDQVKLERLFNCNNGYSKVADRIAKYVVKKDLQAIEYYLSIINENQLKKLLRWHGDYLFLTAYMNLYSEFFELLGREAPSSVIKPYIRRKNYFILRNTIKDLALYESMGYLNEERLPLSRKILAALIQIDKERLSKLILEGNNTKFFRRMSADVKKDFVNIVSSLQ